MEKSRSTTTILPRPPIVVVLGHVDHGKTTLLDYIRKTNLTAQESGGITQHIGAYQVKVKSEKTKTKSESGIITFIDTPGHEAFAKMRARGAQVADIGVLVVAANDGVQPQTQESISLIKQANLAMVVAINKVDLPGVDIQKIKQQLAKAGVLVENFGGDIVAVPISAKTGQGVQALLEVILLIGQMREIQADPQSALEAVVIEAKLDKHRGPLAAVIVRQGTLHLGQTVYADSAIGKVRSMVNDQGERITTALPAMPAEIMGWSSLPEVGAKVSTEYNQSLPVKPKTQANYSFSLPPIDEAVKLNLVLKTDVAGTLEAIQEKLGKLVKIVAGSAGEITESDVLLAKSTKALIIGFRVKPTAAAVRLAETEGVRIKPYQVIYQLIDEVAEAVDLLNHPEEQEQILGQAQILAQFPGKDIMIAGGKVMSGRIALGDLVKLVRNKQEIGRTRLKTMHQGKKEIKKVQTGEEFGITFDKQLDFKIKDLIISYKKNPLLI